MAYTYIELKTQIDKLQAQADALKEKEKAGVIKRIKEAIHAYGLNAEDLGLIKLSSHRAGANKKALGRQSESPSKRTNPPKYKDDAGNTWSGRGPRPSWLKSALSSGASLESFTAKG